ncbi:hypothetical protein QAD02_013802 [Eretmocerus hayati]|uniref:Uncharacterized protein n=1 Tax=Eretmocerus hayati TaxID=131215 RepID=A0ACC2P8B5_9HYME|nr:hypothetical protein QAD02_013802 [Eretmocerus hayati]
MISESSDALDLEFFLTSWLQDGMPKPAEMVVGYAHSLLDPVSMAFNSSSFEEYNLRCFKYLSNELEEIPNSRIQVDMMTIIKVIIHWDCYQSSSEAIKDFYLKSIIFMNTLQDVETSREIVVTVLISCQSLHLTETTELRIKNLRDHLSSDTFKEMKNEKFDFMKGKDGTRSLSYYNPVHNKTTLSTDHELYNFIEDCAREAHNLSDFSSESDRPDNDLFCPLIMENLIQLLSEFPSWTQILREVECPMLVSCTTKRHSSIFPNWRRLDDIREYLTTLDKLEP